MLVARILADSAKTENNAHVTSAEARRQLTKATAMHERAKAQLEKGEIAAADRSLNDAMRLISKVRNQAADTDLRRSAEQSKYSQLMQSVEALESSYFRNVERRSAWLAEVGDEDLKRVKILVNRAQTMASSGRYAEANATLVKAQRDMVSSYNGLLGTAPLIYDLHFVTTEEEYKYESERGRDYEGLVPVAIVDYKPSRESLVTIDRLVNESRALAAQARTHADKGQFQIAILSQREAIAKLQRALEVAGIVVPQRIPN
jgi:tetratricopeptide (TPR) repeat protein